MIIVDFQENPECMKCGHTADFRPTFCEDEKCSESRCHIHMQCARCCYSWFMIAANDDIEQEFDDLDKYSERCPMCHTSSDLEITYCNATTVPVMDVVIPRKGCVAVKAGLTVEREHLHVKCPFCDYTWTSETKDYKPGQKKPAAEPKLREARSAS